MELVITKIRADLKKVAEGKRGAADFTQGLALMTALYYDLDDALHAGASQTEVWQVFQAHGLNITKTRFNQNIIRLRNIFPPRERGVRIEPDQLANMAKDIHSLAVVAAKAHGGNSQKKNRAPRSKAHEAPLAVRVQLCTSVIERLMLRQADIEAIASELRETLGVGWSLKVAIQFVAGTRFADWAQANPGQKDRFKHAHELAKQAVTTGLPNTDKLPDFFATLVATARGRTKAR